MRPEMVVGHQCLDGLGIQELHAESARAPYHYLQHTRTVRTTSSTVRGVTTPIGTTR